MKLIALNILGSLFYGTTIAMFLVGFGLRWVHATPVLISARGAEPGAVEAVRAPTCSA